ncbi:hypothetical protein K503DRAFT_857432 [Rhizopogon vinicolor AM-OR11-026]|uniref:Uncharacterized protein n=1 Tax=Rhizopogon vinicolor AM-OR11-026 TaxID=1314800 RepID=A0A1B7MXJ3_9AGAM|nr:hypothetical protein K503DRAFT_857432 [Rhizopogon vinicolor AM-OR11-026]
MFSFRGAGTGLVSEGKFYSQPQNPRWGGESYSSSPLSLPILPLPDPFSDSGSCSYQRSQFQQNPGLARALPGFRITGGQTDYGVPRYSQSAIALAPPNARFATGDQHMAYDKDTGELVTTDKWDKTVGEGRMY